MWTTDWPKEIGYYWFYGSYLNFLGRRTYENLHFVKVQKVGPDTFAYFDMMDEQMLHPDLPTGKTKEGYGAQGHWQPVELPTPP